MTGVVRLLFMKKIVSVHGGMVRCVSTVPTTKLYINGQFVESKTDKWKDVYNPATNQVISRVPDCTRDEMEAAVASAKEAYKTWSWTSVLTRQQCMFKLSRLIKENLQDIVKTITRDCGKTLYDSKAEVLRGIHTVEQCCSIASLQLGETMPNVSTDVDTFSFRMPVGVCAGVTPFNFPAMIPLSVFPLAIACGNTFVLRPSGKAPAATMVIMELLKDAGIPDGVVNVIHGEDNVLTTLCDSPIIRTISFVGSDRIGRFLYERGSKSGKRVLANMGAKNHAVIMPDANKSFTLRALVGGAFEAAGQRCMALSTAVFVGESKKWLPEVVEMAKKMKVSEGSEPGVDLGPLITHEDKNRVSELIQSGVDEGAELLLDGRDIVVKGYEDGNFVGPTILHNVKTSTRCYTEEIFGPVLVSVEVDTLDDAINLINKNPYGNGSVIFTTNGASARRFTMNSENGMIGVNVAIPIPVATFSFTGSRASFWGDNYINGRDGVNFFTQTKTVTQMWRSDDVNTSKPGTSFPVMQ